MDTYQLEDPIIKKYKLDVTYGDIIFYVDEATDKQYGAFIDSFRELARTGFYKTIPLLPLKKEKVKYLIVSLVTTQSNHSIQLLIQRHNLYLVAYKSDYRNQWFEFKPDAGEQLIFGNEDSINLGFRCTYHAILRVASKDKFTDFVLGQTVLGEYVHGLAMSNELKIQAHGIFVVIQIVIEAARFPPFARLIKRNFHREVNFPKKVEAMVKSWKKLCKKIQLCQDENSFRFELTGIDSFSQAKKVVGIMLDFSEDLDTSED